MSALRRTTDSDQTPLLVRKVPTAELATPLRPEFGARRALYNRLGRELKQTLFDVNRNLI